MSDPSKTFSNKPLVVTLYDEAARDFSLVGGKAANLAKLLPLPGVRIPPAFVITTEAYRCFFNENPELTCLIADLDGLRDEEQVHGQAEKIRQAMKAAGIPESTAASIKAGYDALRAGFAGDHFRVSVRSSAKAEDGQVASFAGQYETCLNQGSLQSVIESVRRVWISAFGINAVHYRNSRGIKHAGTEMAVILQRMVDARAAGTAFTVDLETGAPMIRIHANYGLGEGEVRGSATPDVWIVDPVDLTIVKRTLGEKSEKIFFDGLLGTTVACVTEFEERANFALSSTEVRGLAHRVRYIGDYFGGNQQVKYVDVEFAVEADGRIAILQVRPETAWGEETCSLVAVSLDRACSRSRWFLGGFTASPGVADGRLCVAGSLDEAEQKVWPGDILVVPNTTNLWERVLGRCAGAITEIGSPGCHTAIVMREQGKAAITGASGATGILRAYENQLVTLDATQRFVFLGQVPKDWLFQVRNLQPSYGTVDSESEDESWDEAARTGQTCAGPDGRRWIGKPKHPVGIFMQEIYRECHAHFGKRIAAPVRAEIRDAIHWVDFHDIWQWRLKIRAMTLEQLEALHGERLAAVQSYLESCNSFTLNPDAFLLWVRSFVEMNAFMGAAYSIFKVTEGLLEQELSGLRLKEPYYSQVRPSMGALLGETEALGELRGYKEILSLSQSNDAWLRMMQEAATGGELSHIRQKADAFYGRLEQHASQYKVVKNTDIGLSLEDSIRQVAARLVKDVSEGRKVHLGESTPAEFYPDDERFVRIARLALESEKARQNAHHLNYRGHWPVRKKLQTLAKWLAERGEVSDIAGLFDHTPGWLLRQIIRYRMFQWLGGFLGRSCEMHPVPEDVSIEKYEQLRSLDFDIFYLPSLDLEGMEPFRKYPEWHYPLENPCRASGPNGSSRMTGRWVAVELRTHGRRSTEHRYVEKPSERLCNRPKLVSWNVLQRNALPETAKLLGLDCTVVGLPSALEWNLMGNLIHYRRRLGESVPDWAVSASGEWTRDRNPGGQRALVGSRGNNGADKLQSVDWIDADDDGRGRAHGFRAVITL